MTQEYNPYKNYTSTSMIAGVDEATVTAWSAGYFRQLILPHLPQSKDAIILEIGCGYGRHVKTLVQSGYRDVTGIDISEEQVAYAREKLGLNNVYLDDALAFLEQSDRQYDAILLLDVLEHLENEYAVTLINRIRASLKEGGRLVLHVPNALAPLAPYRYWDITHQRAYTNHNMNQTLLLGGFELAKIHHYELPTYAHGFKSAVRRALWRYAIKPTISAFMLTVYGDKMGGIYTINRLTVVQK